MAEPSPETFTFLNSRNQEQTIETKDLVTILPDNDSNNGTTSLIIHVSPQPADSTTPPTLNITKGTPTSTPPPQISSPPSLPSTLEYETHIIISTGSGTNLASSFFKQAVSPLLHALFPSLYPRNVNVHTTESASSILDLTNRELLPAANSGRHLLIILLSGDGGIVDLVNGLLAHGPNRGESYVPPKLIPLPLGTANALYHSTYPPTRQDQTWGLRFLSTVLSSPGQHPSSTSTPTTNLIQWRALPTFTATFSPGSKLLIDEARSSCPLPRDAHGTDTLHGAVVFSWGMHASLVADSDSAAYRRFGIERFKMAAKEALYPADGGMPHAYKGRVLESEVWTPLQEEQHMYVLATLVSRLEKTFTISPSSTPLGDSLHLVRFGPRSGDDAMRLMSLAYQDGKHVQDPAVLYEGIDGLRIEFGVDGGETEERWRRVCVDGKIVVVGEAGWVEVRKGEVRAGGGKGVLDVAVSVLEG
ncbi:uncharacterized protein EI97DRAFT_411421 [Westerdykella ornata]|uniref:DAGKc domain-containing protein n=1 Tax=Westerdykella ornata TaxID=318751 RepID=A0A6A6JV64_WESOR|nr:uncharacterized protein EI97DRAFT_411421 [Westerdykella ornata]KAF2280277.1 hypothetical protein EI97DRAFT_411421 [Westerdykella ornata]